MSFENAIEFTLKWEGNYSNDPNDPGGETKYGISKRAYSALNIRDLTLDQAKEIYQVDYWKKAGCDELPEPFGMCVFDTAVNMGVSRARALMQDAKDWEDYLFLRLERYLSMRTKYPQFIFGWMNRTMALWRTVRGEI